MNRPLRSVADRTPAPRGDFATREVRIRVYWIGLAGLLLIAAVATALLAGGGGTSSEPTLFRAGTVVTEEPARFWENLDPASVSFSTGKGLDGIESLRVSLVQPRKFFALAQHAFAGPQSYPGSHWLYLEFRGAGNGAAYSLILDYNTKHENSAVYNFVDTTSDWHVFAFDLTAPNSGDVASTGKEIISMRLSTPAKQNTGSFELGRVTVSRGT